MMVLKRIGLVCLLVLAVLIAMPAAVFAQDGNNRSGMAAFTDGDSDHVYQAGDSISFTIGPFPCQAGKTDYLVFGIMERDGGDFLTDVAPVTGLTSGTQGYYLSVTADNNGVFSINTKISSDAQLKCGVLAIKIYSQEWNLLVNESTGAEAFMPVVDASGTTAIIIGAVQEGPPSDPTLAASLLKNNDNDLDHVYFDGQTINMYYQLSSGIQLPPGIPIAISVTAGIFTNPQDPKAFDTSCQPLKNIVTAIKNNTIEVTGVINNPGNTTLPTGMLGTKLIIPAVVPAPASLGDPMPAVSNDGKGCLVGVHMPEDMGAEAVPAFKDIKNLYNTEVPITFTKAGQGSITFTPGLNIIDNRDQLDALDDGIRVEFDSTAKCYVFSAATPSLEFLEGKSAGLKAFGVMSKLQLPNEFPAEAKDQMDKYVRMAVTDNQGLAVPDAKVGDYIDTANVIYNPDEDSLLIPVKHFTAYNIGKVLTPAPELPDNSQYEEFMPTVSTIDISADKVWRIKFSKPVDKAAPDQICIWRTDTPAQVTVVPAVDSGDPTVVLVNHPEPFAQGAAYTLYIGPNIKDAAGVIIKQAKRMTFLVK